jgi:Spy/CpxP family protein refolding chaperone
MNKLAIAIIGTAMYTNLNAAEPPRGGPSGRPVKSMTEKLDLTAEQAKRMRAAHMRYVKEVSKILTEKQFEQWKKERADHREEHHPNRKTVKPLNRPNLRRPKGK